MFTGLSYNILFAWEAIRHNKLRALLTSLGIVFGVASVISMVAIQQGAQQEILEQMKQLGTNNIVIRPLAKQSEGAVSSDDEEKQKEKKKFSPGLTFRDAESIREVVPEVVFVSPEIVWEAMAIRAGLKRTVKLVGVTNRYFETADFTLAAGGWFATAQAEEALPVCIIGSAVKTKFFAREDPLGKQIKCGQLWLTVVGVLAEKRVSSKNISHLGLRDNNMDVYTPLATMLLRCRNRGDLTRQDLDKAAQGKNNSSAALSDEEKNVNQLDRIVVRVDQSERISAVAGVISRMLERRHNGVVDFEVMVPELLLRQERRTKTIFSVVLGAIASISLVVGGIGIMNIMLASVMERIKEIGIRLAVGATPQDIVTQFLLEAVLLSVVGGVAGTLLGVGLSFVIEKMSGIVTTVSPAAVALSFCVAFTVGLIFGIMPAKKAAAQNPIASLRYE